MYSRKELFEKLFGDLTFPKKNEQVGIVITDLYLFSSICNILGVEENCINFNLNYIKEHECVVLVVEKKYDDSYFYTEFYVPSYRVDLMISEQELKDRIFKIIDSSIITIN